MICEKKLKVINEIMNVMEYYNSLFLKVVFYLIVEYKCLVKKYGLELKYFKLIIMGMWIGGDCDGNLFVIVDILK